VGALRLLIIANQNFVIVILASSHANFELEMIIRVYLGHGRCMPATPGCHKDRAGFETGRAPVQLKMCAEVGRQEGSSQFYRWVTSEETVRWVTLSGQAGA
jgi:hypothetical protein